MPTLIRTFGTLTLTLAGFGLQAGEDFTALAQVARTTWPDKNHIGVICDYRHSQEQVDQLAQALGGGARITVVDVRHFDHTAHAARLMAARQADYLVLLPEDRVVRDGSMGGSMAVYRLARQGIPTVATTPRALAQGAVFSLGEGTHGELLVTNSLIGTVDVILPAGVRFAQKASLPLFQDRAEVTVVAPE